jgi:uncharacterized membrane protein
MTDAGFSEHDSSTTGLSPRVAAALAYSAGPFSGVLVLLAERTSRFVRFHAWQSVIALGGLGVIVAALIVSAFLSIVVSAAAFRTLLYVGWAAWGVWIVLWALCLVQALGGRSWKLPIAGSFAERKSLPADRRPTS